MSKIIEHNVTTGEVIERDMNEDELLQLEADKLAAQIEFETQEQVAKAKSALLAKLGITEEEARLLLGGN